MTSVIIGCSGASEIARKIARRLHLPYSKLSAEKFPDRELHVGFNTSIKGKIVFLVQSFYNNISDKILEVLFAAQTAKDLGASKVMLIAPYFPYLRQDKRFKEGESISAKIVAKIFSKVDKVFIVEPHAHRLKRFKDFFPNAVKISAADVIAGYIKKKFDDYVLIGPDEESSNWIIPISKQLSIEPIILRKKRLGPKSVKILSSLNKEKKVKIAIIVDDIISTGDTMVEAGKEAKKIAETIHYIGIHGILVGDAMKKLRKQGEVVSCNSIPSSASKIDLSKAISDEIKRFAK
ncbi:MAG: ribose-phosphate diphosphokinase [Nanoarchaeota archaeon]|nr:ribose-phosphate diphosphokinase [Nanoarchaeota archaeon]